MRRYLAMGLLASLLGQSSGSALALSSGRATLAAPPARAGLAAPNIVPLFAPLLSAIENSQVVAQLSGNGDRYAAMHRPKPVFADRAALRRPIDDNVSKSRLSHAVLRRGRPSMVRYPTAPPRTRTRDPLAVRSAALHRTMLRAPQPLRIPAPETARTGFSPTLHAASVAAHPAAPEQRLGHGAVAPPLRGHARMQQQVLASSDAGAGINRWWEYEEHAIPGIGKAMLNVGTGNLVIQATDVAIPESGLGLVFQRTYNSQSRHDAGGDDGSGAGHLRQRLDEYV